jgi:two-component system sensor histidine kinase/response regulator
MKTILVIGDEESLRSDIMELLNFEGFATIGAENGRVGIEHAQERLPDLIICDIMMPQMNGFEVLNHLNKNPQTAAIPFIFVSAQADPEIQREGMLKGANDYLTKPFTVDELLNAINTQLKKRAAIWEEAQRRQQQLANNIILAMPHELRTPLTIILGFTDLIKSDIHTMDRQRIYEMVSHINNAGIRLYSLVENYLIYAQIEIFLSDAEADSSLLLAETRQPRIVIEDQILQRATHHHRREDLILNIPDVKSISIMEDYLKKIVTELADNAFKFSEPHTPVTISGHVDEHNYILTFIDEGPGMTPDEIKAIGAFMQFNRKFNEQQGSGLGLTIAIRLAEIFQGTLEIKSQPDIGTTVILTLPLNA